MVQDGILRRRSRPGPSASRVGSTRRYCRRARVQASTIPRCGSWLAMFAAPKHSMTCCTMVAEACQLWTMAGSRSGLPSRLRPNLRPAIARHKPFEAEEQQAHGSCLDSLDRVSASGMGVRATRHSLRLSSASMRCCRRFHGPRVRKLCPRPCGSGRTLLSNCERRRKCSWRLAKSCRNWRSSRIVNFLCRQTVRPPTSPVTPQKNDRRLC